ncbi:hydroxymethylbilane synthase [Caldanaerobacter sp.]|uniref:hydroxymethylbilane synthase n=1 Tax=Caldanaerobacter sp. TaxID=2930036 RepID=UPI003C77BE72
MKKVIRVGTRGSTLAVKQTELVLKRIKEKNPYIEFEIVKITTKGDKMVDKPVEMLGGKGVFVKEIEKALLRGEIDMAVHSMKDMPYETVPGLLLIPVLERENPQDVLVSRGKVPLKDLRGGAKIATSSLRRKAQITRLAPHVEVIPIRGNIETRINKMEEQNLDGLILAASGLIRLGLTEIITEYFPTDVMVPAAWQGILAVEFREDFYEVFNKTLYPYLYNKKTQIEAEIERKFLKIFGVDCRTPFGVYANYLEDGKVHVNLFLEKGEKFFKKNFIADIKNIDEAIDRLIKEFGDEI